MKPLVGVVIGLLLGVWALSARIHPSTRVLLPELFGPETCLQCCAISERAGVALRGWLDHQG